MKVLVIGSGTMGSGIAEVIAANNNKVYLNDINNELIAQGLKKIEKDLDKQVAKEKITLSGKNAILENIVPVVNFEAASDAEIVIEAAVENMDVKKQIFAKLDKVINKEAVFCTNTSSLSITEIASGTLRPDKVIGMHFFNPAPVMKLVEVIKGVYTSELTTEKIMSFAKMLGKDPILAAEAPGFVVNRILVPMINEAIGVFADNIASKEDIDKAMMSGCNHPIGPLALSDLIGNDVVLSIMEVLYKEFGDSKYRPHPLLKKMVRAKLLGKKAGEGFYKY